MGMLGLVIDLPDGGAVVDRPLPVSNDAFWTGAAGGEYLPVYQEPEFEHYQAPSRSLFLGDVMPGEVYNAPVHQRAAALQDVRYWIRPDWEGQTLGADDFLGGSHTFFVQGIKGSGASDYPGMLPIESYKVVTDRGVAISFTDYVNQSELYQ